MRINNTCLEIDFTGCDRIVAVLVGENGEIYEGDTHQECLHDYCMDVNYSPPEEMEACKSLAD